MLNQFRINFESILNYQFDKKNLNKNCYKYIET